MIYGEGVYVRSCVGREEEGDDECQVSDDDVDEVRGDLIGPTTHHVQSRPAEGDRPSSEGFPSFGDDDDVMAGEAGEGPREFPATCHFWRFDQRAPRPCPLWETQEIYHDVTE